MLCSTVEGRRVHDDTHDETGDDGDRHERAKFIDDSVEFENARDVERDRDHYGGVEGPDARAIVFEFLPSEMGKRLAVGVDTREIEVEDAFHQKECPVYEPGTGVREGARVHEVSEMSEKVGPCLAWSSRWEFAVVVDGAYPHVPHEQWEANHHGCDAE